MAILVKQSTAQSFGIFMADSSDGKTGKTGLTLTVTLKKYGETSFSSISPTQREIGNGHYEIDLTTTHMNTVGLCSIRATSTGADPADCPNCIDVIAFDKTSATSLGLSNLDAAITTRLAPTTAGRTLDVAATGEAGLDFDNIKAASAPTTLTNITVPTVTTVGTLTTYTGNTPQTGDAFARLGAPVGASISADIAAKATAASLSTAQTDITRLLGLMHENSVDDNHVYSSSKLTSCRKRVFSSKANALAATPGAADDADSEVARYLLTFTYTGDDLTGASWVRDL